MSWTRTLCPLIVVALCAGVVVGKETDQPEAPSFEVRSTLQSPVTPFVIDIDLARVPAPRQWQPGDPVWQVPKRAYPQPGAPALLPDEGRDPLLDAQLSYTVSLRAGGGGFTIPLVNEVAIPYNGAGVPDTVGDVGDGHLIESINGTTVRIWDKAVPTPNILTTFTMDSLGTGACANGLGDPVILFDRNAGRWVLMEFVSGGTNLCVYISQSGDPVSGGWYAYNFVAPSFPDYPKMGVWPTDANGGGGSYVVTANSGTEVLVMERGPMLLGNTAGFQTFGLAGLPGFGFQAATPADIDGPDLPPSGAPAVIMRHRDTEVHSGPAAPGDLLEMWALSMDWVTSANSVLTGLADIDVADFSSELCGLTSFSCMEQPGTGVRLDPLREVIMNRLQYIHHGNDGFETLVGNFVVDVSGTDQGGIRWFELRRQDGAANPWTLHQEGTYSIDTDTRWMGASSMDQSRNIALAYNISSSTTFPGLRYTGRLADDPLGVMTQPETTIVPGSASSPTNRYGDYAAMGLDPTDDCTFWFFGEYNPSSQWSTRMAAFKFDSCGCLLEPQALPIGTDTTVENEVTLSWPDSELAEVIEYAVLRSRVAGGPYETIATIPDSSLGVANGTGYAYTDDTVSGGVPYFYVIEASDGLACRSTPDNEVEVVPAGLCLLEPVFDGIVSADIDLDATCGLVASWAPGQAECGPKVFYNLYRSTDPSFVPGPATLVAGGIPGLSALDQNDVVSGQEYTYVVRALDSANLVEDDNMVKASIVAGGTGGQQTIFFEDWEDSATFSDWTVTTGPGFHRCGEWALSTDGSRRPGLGSGQYVIANSFDCSGVLPATSASIDSPVIDTSSPNLATVILEFDVFYNHQNGDDGTVEVWDGAQWVVVWNDPNSDLDDHVVIDVSAWALGNAAFRVRFNYQDANVDRWYSVDNVRLGVDVICNTAPEPNPAPSGAGATGPLLVGRAPGASTLSLSWDAASCGSGEFNLIHGTLDNVATYALSGAECSIGNSGAYDWATPPAGAIYYLIVGGDGAGTESSWGQSTFGERNGLIPSGQCGAVAKNVVATCE